MSSPVAVASGTLDEEHRDDRETVFLYRSESPVNRLELAVAPYVHFKDRTGRLSVFCFPGDEEGVAKVLDTAQTAMILARSGWDLGRRQTGHRRNPRTLGRTGFPHSYPSD